LQAHVLTRLLELINLQLERTPRVYLFLDYFKARPTHVYTTLVMLPRVGVSWRSSIAGGSSLMQNGLLRGLVRA
jgi:hypothetical protein